MTRCASFLLNKKECCALLFLAFAFIVFGSSALWVWLSGLSWHDHQRLCQLFLLGVAATWSAYYGCAKLPTLAFGILFVIFSLGLASSLFAEWPWWALKEWGRYIGLLLVVLVVGRLASRREINFFILVLIALVGTVHAFQFLARYVSAFLSGVRLLDVDLLYTGFSNPRFLGQFQVVLMPLLAFFIIRLWVVGRYNLAALMASTLTVQWCIALMLGGRGLWLGLVAGYTMLLFVQCTYWRMMAIQLAAGLVGAFVFALLFYLIPLWFDISPTLRDGLRGTLSGRELLWKWAWDMAVANPLLGVGPMHYSATINPIAAHPHQVVLQWAAEWGFIVAVLAILLVVWGVLHGAKYLRRSDASEYDAALWVAVVGGLILAQVDGVFVMPYAETWMAILVGLGLARWSVPAQPSSMQRFGTMLLALPVIIIVSKVLFLEVPRYVDDSSLYKKVGSHEYTPRFWQQGWIPMINGAAAD